MTGYDSKRDMAQDKLAQPEQEPVDDHIASIIALRDMIDAQPVPESLYFKDLAQPAQEPVGFVDSKLNPIQRPWVDLTPQDLNEIFAIARTGEHAVRLASDKLKERNA